MSTLPLEEKRNNLLALYNLHTTKGPHVEIEELEELANVGPDFYPIIREVGLRGRGWLQHANLIVRIQSAGIIRAEGVTEDADG